ncbi:pentapeptide repeat-containing protein [Achromobacter sp.]|uniref:pentapeptide repeat-containing protein n=1 Tax=Achromobacter sp. TaxID=134375 RepID=UPI0039B9B267
MRQANLRQAILRQAPLRQANLRHVRPRLAHRGVVAIARAGPRCRWAARPPAR